MKLYRRENYLKRIRGFYNDYELIKVITGVRRCGKSSLMQTILEEIVESGVDRENIFFLNLDLYGYRSIKKPEDLERVIDSLPHTKGLKYLFIDEIQNVNNFEEVINEYRETGEYSIFITGSNSYLLSGELVTKLTGRYIEFELTTLSFEEYVDMKKFYGKTILPNLKDEFEKYIIEGGFPKSIFYDSQEDRDSYTQSIVSEIFEKDIRRRVKIVNRSVFEKVQIYMINNYGAITSLKNILEELHKGGMNIKRETLNRYIKILIDAKILNECKRFDLKSKKSINGEQKYYLTDLSFYNLLNPNQTINYGPVLENIIYNYAKSKKYNISIGRIGKLECDFVMRSASRDYSYVQVCTTFIGNSETEEREYRPLEKIKDNYPKYILTLDDPLQKRNGIITRKIPEAMVKGEIF